MVKKGAITMTDAKGQDRLDRLEKLAEEMFTGIAQLTESQEKTDEQPNRPDPQLHLYTYDLMNKYGFGDGRHLLEEEDEILEQICHRFARALGVIDERWEPTVMSTGHNPFYVAFFDRLNGEIVSFYETDEKDRRKIEERIWEVFH
jgi:hypothetical protein